jgi:hypothetical protein
MLILCPATRIGSYTVPASVTTVSGFAFASCTSLTNIILGDSVASVGSQAFDSCTSLIRVTIPSSVTNIGNLAFYFCTNVTGVYLQGNAPNAGTNVFYKADLATIYYLPGTFGWSSTFAGRPTALWQLPNPLMLTNGPDFGIHTNAFGFRVSWATNIPVVIEATTNLAEPVWSSLVTNALAGGWFYFSDPEWTNYLSRIYRVRSL